MILLFFTLVGVAIFFWNCVKEYFGIAPETVATTNGVLYISSLDVGQGSATLLEYEGQTMLVDAGETDQGQAVLNALEQHNITHLNKIVASHPHSDHIGGMAQVLQTVSADLFYEPNISEAYIPTTRVYENMLDALEQNGAEYQLLTAGDSFSLGDVQIKVLSPALDWDDSNLNNWSAVLEITYGNTKALIMGDSEKEVERNLIARCVLEDIDLLIVGHHGSGGSSTDEFLSCVMPETAFISVGTGNSYGHPHGEALSRLEAWADIYRTDLQGELTAKSDGRSFVITTEK